MSETPDTLYVQYFTVNDIPVYTAYAEPRPERTYVKYTRNELLENEIIQLKRELDDGGPKALKYAIQHCDELLKILNR